MAADEASDEARITVFRVLDLGLGFLMGLRFLSWFCGGGLWRGVGGGGFKCKSGVVAAAVVRLPA